MEMQQQNGQKSQQFAATRQSALIRGPIPFVPFVPLAAIPNFFIAANP